MVADRKLYDVLGVEPTANETEIKRAFKLKALKLHPDKTGNDPKSAELFKEATDAYEVLGDAERRSAYDQFGMAAAQPGGGGDGGINVDLSDLFGNMFGGMFGGMRPPHHHHQQQRMRRTDGVQVMVTLTDVFHGSLKSIAIELPDMCGTCKGHGVQDPAADIIQCIRCNGVGVVTNQMGPFLAQTTCGSCFGKGKMVRPGRACGDCGGQKVKQTKRTFEVRLPKGLPNGHTHTIKEKGSFSPEDMTNADVRLTFVYALPCREESGNGCQVEVQRIENADVHVRVTVTLAELLCRFETTVRMWSKPIKIRSSAYFNPRESYRFPGAGMPRFKKDGEFGDIVATFDVTFPPGRDFAKYSPVFAKALRLGGDPSAAAVPPPDTNAAAAAAAAAADVFLCDLTPGVQQGGGGGVAGSTL